MSRRNELLASIAHTIDDYRAGEIAKPSPDHVDRWVCQFDRNQQIPLLIEFDHTLKHTYFARSFVTDFFASQIRHRELAGSSPCEFWRAAHCLNLQRNGHSQREINQLFALALRDQCGLESKNCSSPGGAYIYIDDVLFTGGRIGADLSAWIRDEAPAEVTVHVLVIAAYVLGEWQCKERLKKVAADAGKKVQLHCWAAARFENRLTKRDSSEVLWPAVIPQEPGLLAYIDHEPRFPFQPRNPGAEFSGRPFSSEAGRRLLEEQFLLAGMRIRSFSQNPSPLMRPLGFSSYGLGFGSLIATFRNCPNNAPLALWWGDPDAPAGHPFRHWRPLLPRKTYSDADDS